MGQRHKKKAPDFVMVRKDLMKDPQWRELSSSAKVIYIYLRAKFHPKVLGDVTLAYREVEDMMSSKTISDAFKELQTAGFIEKIKYGGLYGGVSSYRFIGKYSAFFYKGYEV